MNAAASVTRPRPRPSGVTPMVAMDTTATAAERAGNLRALAKRDRKALLIEHKELSDLLTALEKERKGRSGRYAVPRLS